MLCWTVKIHPILNRLYEIYYNPVKGFEFPSKYLFPNTNEKTIPNHRSTTKSGTSVVKNKPYGFLRQKYKAVFLS